MIGYSYKGIKKDAVVELEIITEEDIIRELVKMNADIAIDFDKEKFVIDSVVTAV